MLLAACQEPCAYFAPIIARFGESAYLVRFSLSLAEILVHLIPVAEIVPDDRVHIGELERRLVLDDLLGWPFPVVATDDEIEEYASLADANGPAAVNAQRCGIGGNR